MVLDRLAARLNAEFNKEQQKALVTTAPYEGRRLLLVKPLHAVIFVIFTFILQFIDPYFIKPRLFGNTLGVSGLLIVVSVLVCGRMFGVTGILLSMPLAAILSFVYKEAILPALERRAEKRKADMIQ